MARSTRDPVKTRHELLEAAFWEIFDVGFQAASLDRILRKTGVTKGALYHHFRNKTELGYAVVDEIIASWIRRIWVVPLGALQGNVLGALREHIQASVSHAAADGLLSKGCPLNNLAQEMSPLDEGFRRRIEAVFSIWTGAFAQALSRGQETGDVRSDIDPLQTARFIVATLEGVTGMAKNQPSMTVVQGQLDCLFLFLDSLRAPAAQPA